MQCGSAHLSWLAYFNQLIYYHNVCWCKCVYVCVDVIRYPHDLRHTHSQIKRRVIAIILLRYRKSTWIEGERAKTRFFLNFERISFSVDYTTIEENSRTRIKLEWFYMKWGSHTILCCDLSLSLNRIADNCVNSSITAHKINNNGYGYSVYISVHSSLSLSLSSRCSARWYRVL